MGRRFNVKPPRLRSASVEIHGYSRQVVQISYGILDVARSLGGMSGMAEVCRTLKHILEDTAKEAGLLSGLSDAAGRISTIYDKTENNISINGEKSRQKFPVHRIAAWNFSGSLTVLPGIRILR